MQRTKKSNKRGRGKEKEEGKRKRKKGSKEGIAIMVVDFCALTMHSPLYLLIWEKWPSNHVLGKVFKNILLMKYDFPL